jgi:hypothetical protein
VTTGFLLDPELDARFLCKKIGKDLGEKSWFSFLQKRHIFLIRPLKPSPSEKTMRSSKHIYFLAFLDPQF